jgi:hypothetical protein
VLCYTFEIFVIKYSLTGIVFDTVGKSSTHSGLNWLS